MTPGWRFVFACQARKDAKKLAAEGLRPNTQKLLDLPANDPFAPPPRFEKLVGDLAGAYSQGINIHHRLLAIPAAPASPPALPAGWRARLIYGKESILVIRQPLPKESLEPIRRIAARHGVRDVRLFGSFARGEQRPGSDLDLLIHLEKGRGFIDLLGFCDEVEAALGRHVDVITDDGLSPFLRDRVLAEAIPL